MTEHQTHQPDLISYWHSVITLYRANVPWDVARVIAKNDPDQPNWRETLNEHRVSDAVVGEMLQNRHHDLWNSVRSILRIKRSRT